MGAYPAMSFFLFDEMVITAATATVRFRSVSGREH
jgi:hypothetical protein